MTLIFLEFSMAQLPSHLYIGLPPSHLKIVVDRESFEAQPPIRREQAARLRALRRAGAEVVLCRGFGRLGRLRAKALVSE